MAQMRVVPLGAGQDVGRSCILVSVGGKNVMLDCGMHMGYPDERRFPDFSYICRNGTLDGVLSCVIVSHFHLDHCGALPHMSEIVGYNGPIYMTYPTKAIAPVLLEDYRRIQTVRHGETNFFTSEHIKQCMKKVIAVNLHETVQVCEGLSIKAHYAGHVLGAAMFEVRVGDQCSFVYTGDFNMTPDRHLGAAQIHMNVEPDLLITETTYASTIRDSKRARERDFLKKIHDTVDNGGKVLIPVFALGRAQELCILLESYWDRMDLKYPVYYSAGLAEKANQYYRLFINWTNEKIKKTFVKRNMFDFKHVKPFDQSYADTPGPMVLFSTPGMLHGGQSLNVFKRWCSDGKNMIIMPGYCVQGTVGHKVINGARSIETEGGGRLDVNLAVEYMSFSAHADAKGIMQLIRQVRPRNVMFVHGEAIKMDFLKEKVEKEFGLPVYKPCNGEAVAIDVPLTVRVDVDVELVDECVRAAAGPSKRACPFSGTIVGSATDPSAPFSVVAAKKAMKWAELAAHSLTISVVTQLSAGHSGRLKRSEELLEALANWNKQSGTDWRLGLHEKGGVVVNGAVRLELQQRKSEEEVPPKGGAELVISWDFADRDLGEYVVQCIDGFKSSLY